MGSLSICAQCTVVRTQVYCGTPEFVQLRHCLLVTASRWLIQDPKTHRWQGPDVLCVRLVWQPAHGSVHVQALRDHQRLLSRWQRG